MATTDPTADTPQTHTPVKKVRVPDPLWQAYDTVCKRALSKERSEDLVDHMRAAVREHGNQQELALLDEAERELAARRSRKGGRPRSQPPGA